MNHPAATPCLVNATTLKSGTMCPPLSKSDAQRSLVLAHALSEPALRAFFDEAHAKSFPDDVQVVANGLALLASMEEAVLLDCREGGAPLRILLAQAALTPGKRTTFIGSARLGARPHEPLLQALENALGPFGLRITRGSPWPLVMEAPLHVPFVHFRVSGTESSQYASSLLLACCTYLAAGGAQAEVELTTPVASRGYLGMTLEWIQRTGFSVSEGDARIVVAKGPSPTEWPRVPGDWSSLGYLLVAAWHTRSSVERVDPLAEHPDRELLNILRAVGITVNVSSDNVATVTGKPTRGIVASADVCPDLMPTLAALACVLPEPSLLKNVSILRDKESDRLAGIQKLVEAIGGATILAGNDLTIQPPTSPAATFYIDAENDHRMAMSGTLLCLLTGARLTLLGDTCVAKSFPHFWEEMARIGVQKTSVAVGEDA